MSDSKRKIDKLAREFEQIKKSLNLKDKKTQLISLEAKTTDPDFWNNQAGARKIMQEFGDLKDELETIEKAQKLIDDAKAAAELKMDGDFNSQFTKAEKIIRELEFREYLSGSYDRKNALVSIHAGQGGTEAMDWVSMLYRMYLKYCENREWKAETIHIAEGEEAGLKSVTFKVNGSHVYGYLKGEIGTHRLVRQSPFNADKLRQTSFALVEVLPELEEIDYPELKINDEDLSWQFFRASSQGGQNVQKVSSAVRVKHVPTGITVTSQQERSQQQNRKIAVDLLRAKLWAREQALKEKEVSELKGDYRPASWGNQIRSYVLHPYKMVKDLRTKVEVPDADSVLDGDLDAFIEAELRLKT